MTAMRSCSLVEGTNVRGIQTSQNPPPADQYSGSALRVSEILTAESRGDIGGSPGLTGGAGLLSPWLLAPLA